MRAPALLTDLCVATARVVLPQRGAVANAREAALRDRWTAVQRRDATVAAARAARHPSVGGRPRASSAGGSASPVDGAGLSLSAVEQALVADVAPDAGFAAAAENALDLLHQLHAMDLWMVTAVQDGVERVVVARGAGGMPVPPGAVQPWAQSYCRMMVAGQGPRAAPRVRDVPAYAASPATERWGIGAYIGVPLLTGDGALFGVLCGLSAAEQDHRLDDVLGEVERVARLLSTLLAKERAALERSQAAAQAYALADRDPVTGVLNRRGWHARLTVEEERRRRRGHLASVLLVRVEEAGGAGPDAPDAQEVCRRVADALTTASRATDSVARLGLADFGLLAVDCDAAGASRMARRVSAALQHEGILFTLGTASGGPRQDLLEAWRRADAQVQDLSVLAAERPAEQI